MNDQFEVMLANPRGFCAGVDRAIAIVERALECFGAPVYVRHEVVHNRYVVENLGRAGALFVDELSEVPDGALVIFSAHGVSREVRREARARGLRVLDATCPLVTKVHIEVMQSRRDGLECILIGHAGHPEVEGTLGQVDDGMHLVETPADVARLEVKDASKLAYVTQTTLSVSDTAQVIEALRARFPAIRGPRRADICYATQNRQEAARMLAAHCDLVLVVGYPSSSNSNRLVELVEQAGVRARLVEGAGRMERGWLDGKRCIGVTAGASAPEVLVREVVAQLRAWGASRVVERPGRAETITFALPPELQQKARQSAAGAGV